MKVKLLDYERSFIVFESHFVKFPPKTVSDLRQQAHNRARIKIDSLCRITDAKGVTREYYLGESCKTERVGVGKDVGLFTQPNADFRPVMSTEDSIFIKSWDKNDKGVMLQPPSLGPQTERQSVITKDAFWKYCFVIKHREADLLEDAPAIIKASDDGRPVFARTEFEKDGYKILLEYPVKTLNVSEEHTAFQTDTGPVLFPDFSKPVTRTAQGFYLAFIAYNKSDWAEFIVNRPTPIAPGVSVNHYSENAWIDKCKNTLYAID
ncbi:MAG: hypothetical protein FJ319_00050 [SAR202 cluster bacterium]|nr:hypothetical protein [SAR202 cluster bacterium]